MENIENIIKQTNAKNQSKVNWTKAWSNSYPILNKYQEEVDIAAYKDKLREMLNSLKSEYNYSELDAMLVLKDILYHEWKDSKKV